ncbi:MAG: histidine kinase dimerization/phosphoacceptor domain -containing protein [Aulosira sp. ZfuVER01]|nr:histidine kinase dimerization/phosphoacceptor domain -containing protein [Aulosira sp. ZfuVER01]MDZ7998132.1 histidine kinase dimerization/phosphoacceptor domain -containing protein [Aulosira sp. DedVER01a]MDZ8050525.1 histidine kinase dimerization/phosphoacceptor domain -containing protein [Aulosira sp. ZfuCHP01]
MPVLDYVIQDFILTFAPHTPLKEILIYMGQAGENIGIDNGSFVAAHSLHTYRSQVKVVAGQSLPTFNHLGVSKKTSPNNQINRPIDCIYVVDKLQLLGIVTLADVIRLINSGMNLAAVKLAEVMREPVITLAADFDVNKTLTLIQQYGITHLPIVNEQGQLLGIVTPESLAFGLQKELAKITENLQLEIAQRCSLEMSLKKAEEESERRIDRATTELIAANKQLQQGICDRITIEAQLLQTTSELQEIFQVFPDLYFRLDQDGTILSYYAKQTSEFYLPPEDFIGKKMQEVFPANVGAKFLKAILQVQQTNSLVAIEYSLLIAGEEATFEARLLPSVQHQIIAIIRNISECKQVQEALQKAKGELEIRIEERTQELKDTNSRLLQEISERQRIEEALRYRVELEKLITAISTHFINLAPDEIENGINQALQLIGEVTNVDCAYVFVLDEDTKIDDTYKWYADGIEKQIDNLQDIRDVVLSWGREKLSNFETLHLPHVNDLLVTVSTTKLDLTTQNIQSLIIVPIVCSGLLIGYLEFDSVKTTKTWTADSITMLKMVGEILGNALERKRVEQALRISEERYIRAINAGKVGIWEWNIKTNEIYIDPNLQAMLGYTDQEIPKSYDEWLNFVHPDDIEYVKNALNQYLAGITPKYEIEHRMLNKDGSCIWFLSRGTFLCDTQSNECFIAGSNTDITARTQVENKLKVSLKEKEILLKEIHHRVKNNLQIISSLLRLQTRYVKDGETLEIFQDSHNRVRAMAIIHENLYQSHDITKIEFCDYVRSLTNNLLRSYGVNSKNKIHLNIKNISLKIDTAISCGLILNELVTNSIKHAFANNQQGDIYVELIETDKNQYSLIVSDNGVGLSKDIEIYRNQSLGLKLVWSLVEQLEGMITFNTSLGTSFTITFSEQN